MSPTSAKSPAKAIRPSLSASHRRAIDTLLDATDGPFRRSALSKVLYPLTAPRSRQKADLLADAALRELSKAGRIQRQGHLHWIKVSRERVLRSGRMVPEMAEMVALSLTTHCPRKYLVVDMETGDLWAGDTTGWKRASAEDRRDAAACLQL